MTIPFHYPPDLMSLLIDAIPSLFRSKRDVLLFFTGAGVPASLTADLERRLREDPQSLRKHEITRTVLARLNAREDPLLRERREVVKRIVEFEDFSTCWPADQLKAKGLVAEVRRIVGIKDSFTRINLEREKEAEHIREEKRVALERLKQRKEELEAVRKELSSLFADTNPHRRGKRLEAVLNDLFRTAGLLVREGFERVGTAGKGVVEQIDGVVGIDGEIYLVEMRWWSEPLGPGDVSQHLVRVFGRGCARGIIISTSGFTPAALKTCEEALQKTVVVLCELGEIVRLLETEGSIGDFLKAKIHAAILDKEPLHRPLEIG